MAEPGFLYLSLVRKTGEDAHQAVACLVPFRLAISFGIFGILGVRRGIAPALPNFTSICIHGNLVVTLYHKISCESIVPHATQNINIFLDILLKD